MPSNQINNSSLAQALRNNLLETSKTLSTSLARMASGLKILSAKDDAAGTVISSKMQIALNDLATVQKNLQDGGNFLNTAQDAYLQVNDIVTRIRDLSLQSANDTCDEQTRQALQTEAEALFGELERIQKHTKYRDINLFNNIKTEEKKENNSSSDNVVVAPDDGNNGENIGGQAVESGTPSVMMMSRSVNSASNSISNVSNENEDYGISLLSNEIEAQAEDISGAYDFSAKQTQNIVIDGITYTITNSASYESSISYSKLSPYAVNLTCHCLSVSGIGISDT